MLLECGSCDQSPICRTQYLVSVRAIKTKSNFYRVTEILPILSGSSTDKAYLLGIFGKLCRSSHIPQRNYVTEMVFMIRVGVSQLHDVCFAYLDCLRGIFKFFCSHRGGV
jgi:hypothetical protein